MEKRDQSVERHDDGSRVRKPTYAVEVCFLVVMFGVVFAAFIEAFNYKLVSSRTPFVIMVPLLGLILISMKVNSSLCWVLQALEKQQFLE